MLYIVDKHGHDVKTIWSIFKWRYGYNSLEEHARLIG